MDAPDIRVRVINKLTVAYRVEARQLRVLARVALEPGQAELQILLIHNAGSEDSITRIVRFKLTQAHCKNVVRVLAVFRKNSAEAV